MSAQEKALRLSRASLVIGAALLGFATASARAADFEPFVLDYEFTSEQMSDGQGVKSTTKATVYVVRGETANSRRGIAILSFEGDQFADSLPIVCIESDPENGVSCSLSDGMRGSPAQVLLMPLFDHGVPAEHLGKTAAGEDNRIVITAATFNEIPLAYDSKPAEGGDAAGRWTYNVKLARPVPVQLGSLQLNLATLNQSFVFGPEKDYPVSGQWEQIEETAKPTGVSRREMRMRAELKSRKPLNEKDEAKLQKEFDALSEIWQEMSKGVLVSLENAEKKMTQYASGSKDGLLSAAVDPLRSKLAKRLRDQRKLANPEEALKKLVGKQAPDFTLKNLKDEPVKLSSYKGKIVLVTFWGLGCRTCQAALPALQSLYAESKDRGFEVLAVNAYEDPKSQIEDFVTRTSLGYPVLLNGMGIGFEHYAVTDYPSLFWVDRTGKLRSFHVKWKAGDIDLQRTQLETLLSEGGG